ncbi:hypothetical protein ACHAPT_013642, partial [Fusarium lateritium]
MAHESNPHSLVLNPNRYGIAEFSEGIPENCRADIVFVHGLRGKSHSTWRHKDSESPWPKELLARDLGDCKILTYGYDASVIRVLDKAAKTPLRDLAVNFLEKLVNWRRENSSNRPVVFVVHSLGGLLVKRMLRESQSQPSPYNIQAFTCGVIFLGTPHRGSTLAPHGHRLLRALRKVGVESNVELLAILRPDSDILEDTHAWFMTWLRLRNSDPSMPIHVASFYEALPVMGNTVSMAKFLVDETGSGCDSYRSVRAQIENAVRLIKIKDEVALVETAEPTENELKARQACLHSFVYPQVRQRFETVSSHLRGTFQWIQYNETFRSWLGLPEKNVFWLSGKPASGKSTFMKYLTTDEALVSWARLQNPSRKVVVISHFFHYTGQDPSRTFEGFLRSILFQMVESDFAAFEQVRPIFERRRAHQPSPTWPRDDLERACLAVFRHWGSQMDGQRPMVYLVMDALNHFEGELHEMTSFLQDMFELSGRRLKICISSPPEERIDNTFSNLEGLGVLPRVEIQEHTARDIELFIERNYRKLTEIPVSEDQTLADVILEQSRGVFLWVRLVCANLINRAITKTEVTRTSAEELLRLLNKLQPDLERVYEMMFSTIEPDVRDGVEKVLAIVVAASRRLSVEELQCAIFFSNDNNNNNVDDDGRGDEDEDEDEDGNARSVISKKSLSKRNVFDQEFQTMIETRYRGFLEITQVADDGKLIVEPCHGTAFTYLTERCKPRGAGCAFETLVAYGDGLLYESSTAYLSCLRKRDMPPEASDFLELFSDTKDEMQLERIETSVDNNTSSNKWSTTAIANGPRTVDIRVWCSKFPFLSYSTENWGYHAKAGSSTQIEPVETLEGDYFKGFPMMISLWAFWELIIKAWCSLLLLSWFAGNWGHDAKADDSEQAESFDRLQGDSFKCFLWVFWELMEARRVNPYTPSDLPLDALEYLSSTGCAGYLYRALAKQSDRIRHPDRLLVSTIRARSVPMMDRLLQKYSFKKLSIDHGEQAVLQAIDFSYNPNDGKKYESLVESLLNHGFPADKWLQYTIRDEHWNTHPKIRVRKRQFESNPLLLAILLHRNRIVKLLLTHESYKKAVRRDMNWVLYRVLEMATYIQPPNIKGIELLLENGASTEAAISDFNMPELTPLGMALSGKELKVAETLLAHGADANFRCDRASQLSIVAEAENQYPKCLPLLLRWGAEVDVWSMEQACKGHPGTKDVPDVVSVLMDHLYGKEGIDRLIEDRETALHIAIRCDRDDLVDRLLQDFGADASIPDQNGDFPVHVALRQSKAITHIKLLQKSPTFNASVRNRDGRTCFQQAKLSGRASLVRTLRECGMGEDELDFWDEEDGLEDILGGTYPDASQTNMTTLRLLDSPGDMVLQTRPENALHGIEEFIRDTNAPWSSLGLAIPHKVWDADAG